MTPTRVSATILWIFALALLAAGPGCRHLNRLSPEYAWSLDTGLCGWNIVVDEDEALWRESGCESGRPIARRVRRLRPSEVAALKEAFSSLPPDRRRLTPSEYERVREAFASVSRLPETPCHLSPKITLHSPNMAPRTWQVETC